MNRERWGGTWIFVFAAIASAIGLGNVWRFPYLVYNYGGGAFLIPYIVSLIVIGIPWFIAEVGMGQIMQKGAPGTMASVRRRFEWIGWFSVWVAFFIISYYTVVLAWSVLYLVHSITLSWGVGAAAAENVKPFFFGNILGLTNEIT
ncbi:MAG: sodium-dependent transporter, partial [Archaeoglobaceae archaeon]